MAPSPTSSVQNANNSDNIVSPSNDTPNRNKRRRQKRQRQKKQQQKQESQNQRDGPPTNSHHEQQQQRDQDEDCSLINDNDEKTVTTNREDSNLESANNDINLNTNDTCNDINIVDEVYRANQHDGIEQENKNQTDQLMIDHVTSSIDQRADNNIRCTNDNNIANNNSTEPNGASIDNKGVLIANSSQSATDLENLKKKQLLRSKLREYRKLKARFESQTSQMSGLTDHIEQQANKINQLEGLVLNSQKTCSQLEKLLQHEIVCRTKLEQEKIGLNQTVNRLKTQIGIYEKNKLTNDELMRTINATLMERDTEVSMLKLKLTRLQTNPSSVNIPTNGLPNIHDIKSTVTQEKNIDPSKAFILNGRSNSEFSRNSALRSTLIADGSTRSSAFQLKSIDNDSSVWASIPADLTPSRRPHLLEKNFQAIYNESKHNQQSNISTSTPLARDKRYKTLPPRSIIKCLDNHNTMTPGDTTMKFNDVISQQDQSCTTAKSHPNNQCQVTNLDDSGSSGNKSSTSKSTSVNQTPTMAKATMPLPMNVDNKPQASNPGLGEKKLSTNECNTLGLPSIDPTHDDRTLNSVSKPLIDESKGTKPILNTTTVPQQPQSITPLTPSKKSSGFKKIFDRFRRSDSSTSRNSDIHDELLDSTKPTSSPFKRNSNRATLVGLPGDGRAQMSPKQQKISFQTDKPFAEWNTDMIVEWLTMIGLSMYSNQCRRWVKCGAHIMNATPAEVDKGLGITNHLHRKKLRLAISELNGDCDKVTKAAAKLDYLWIARWLDDLGLPQYKESFINARVDGRVLNYLTIEDLISLGVKSVLHHNSIKCGIRVLRSTNFDLQMLKRRATADEIEDMNVMRQQVNHINEAMGQNTPISLKQAVSGASESSHYGQSNQNAYKTNTGLTLWTCHMVMEWLRLIDFAEFVPNLRGSGVHGGLLVYEDGFNFDTLCCLLSIPISRTLLRRHLSSYFDRLIGKDLVAKKLQYRESSPNPHLNPFDEIRSPKKGSLWPLTKLKSSSKVGQNGLDEYLVPMYPMEPQIIKTTSMTDPQPQLQSNSQSKANQSSNHQVRNDLPVHSMPLAQIPESVNV